MYKCMTTFNERLSELLKQQLQVLLYCFLGFQECKKRIYQDKAVDCKVHLARQNHCMFLYCKFELILLLLLRT